MKKQIPLYIGIGIALIFLYKYLNKKKLVPDFSGYQYFFQKNAPKNSIGIFLNMGGQVYDENFNVIYTQLNNNFTGYTVTGESSNTYNVIFGDNYETGIRAIIFKTDVAK